MAKASRIKKPPRYAQIKRIALSLPGTSEVLWRGTPWFNIGKKTFACHWEKNGRWVFRLPHHQVMMLTETRPEIFAPMKSGAMLWLYADAEALSRSELRDYVTAAWRHTAPKKLVKAHLQAEEHA